MPYAERLKPFLILVALVHDRSRLAAGAPLQWESIRPVGLSPAARHSHASVVIPSEQGLLYMFGGCLQEPGKSADSKSTLGIVSNEVWAYDQAAQGWEKVGFQQSLLGCDLPAEGQVIQTPSARAGHSMMSMRTAALTCGGYAFAADGRSKTYLSDAAGRMDCWWLTPGSPSRWDKLKLTSDAPASMPPPRSFHAMSYDTVLRRFVVFGGQTLKGNLLNDCWALSEVEPSGQLADLEYQMEFNWTSCDPASALSLRPHARYGHQSVYFHQSLWVVGGFAQDGLRVSAKQDIWTLKFSAPETSNWQEIMPTTKIPDPRGFHAMWLSGFKIVLHGGQGPTGSGTAAVLGDTWLFDLFTMEWQQKGASAAVPVMSNLAINPLDNSAQAISFGGRNLFGLPSGRLYAFSATKSTPWRRAYPAGTRPSRRTGHTLVYDLDSARIVTSFGLDSSGLQEDTWILDLSTSMWTCWYGTDPTCKHQVPNLKYSGPGKIAFLSQVQLGMYVYLFGGARVQIMPCSALGRGSTGNIAVGTNALDMWVMDMSKLSFQKVSLDVGASPKSTLLSAMVVAAEFPGYKTPLVLAGGADVSCASSSPPCAVPTPSNEIWVMDAAREETLAGTSDRMAELDGADDIIQIVLPSWCNSPMMMSVLWIDSWLLVTSAGQVKTILVEASSGVVPRLRWYLEGADSGTYIKLVLSPGNSEKLIKTWGPLESSFLGAWHHIALTLRMARQYSKTSSEPAIILTQAFVFLDGKHVTEGDTFKTLDLHADSRFESGLSEIIIGGPSPLRKTEGFRNLKGAVDNVRVWWPSCPHEQDPTRCNPYGYLYPQRIDGSRQPASGRDDMAVALVDVAQPIQTHMFGLAPADTAGLLVQLSFDDEITEGIVKSSSTWSLEPCSTSGPAVCQGCNSECVFDKCSLFDADCVESGAADLEAQAVYAKEGTCQCINVDDCPSIEGCLCPRGKGLHKVCTSCTVGVCKIWEPEPDYSPPAPPCGPGNTWSNDGWCSEGDPECPVGSDDVDCYPGLLPGGCDRRSALSCTNSPADFVDRRGDNCDAYLQNPCFCEDAANFSNVDGIHAGMACCACNGLKAVGQGGGNTVQCTLTCTDYERNDVTEDGQCSECDPSDPWCPCPYGADPECCSESRPCGAGQFCDFGIFWGTTAVGQCRECADCPECGCLSWPLEGIQSCTAACGSASRRRLSSPNKTRGDLQQNQHIEEREQALQRLRSGDAATGPRHATSSRRLLNATTSSATTQGPSTSPGSTSAASPFTSTPVPTQVTSPEYVSTSPPPATPSTEGSLCHPAGNGRPSADYPANGPVLTECLIDPVQRHACEVADGDPRPINQDGVPLMTCQALDPMFCPESLFCTEWDCKCYGPGHNDGSGISGGLGQTVFDGDRESLYCGCPTFETTTADENGDEITTTDTMQSTDMPFVRKADQYNTLVMPYQCCDDYFDGLQCTHWDYSGSTPVCLSVLDDHNLRECSATSCCSAYFNDFNGGPATEGKGDTVANNECEWAMDGWCDEPDWCEPETDCDDCQWEKGYSLCIPQPGGGGENPDGGVDGSCQIQIDGPGTFVGTFEPAYWGTNSNQEAHDVHLLGQGAKTASLRMNQEIVFRGTFVPDTEMYSGDAPASQTPEARSMHQDVSEVKAGNRQLREARAGSRGGPGGKKARHDAEIQRGKGGKERTLVSSFPRSRADAEHASVHNRHLLTNISNITVQETYGFIIGTLSFDFSGAYFACAGYEPPVLKADFLEPVIEIFRRLLNNDPGIARSGNTYAINGASCHSDDVFIEEYSICSEEDQDGMVCANDGTLQEAYCAFSVGSDVCARCDPGPYRAADFDVQADGEEDFYWDYWAEWETSASMHIRITVKEAAHRERIVDLLSNNLLTIESINWCQSEEWGLTWFPLSGAWESAPYPVFCGDGVKQVGNEEECDSGSASMSEYSDCNLCKCTQGFVVDEVTDGCICNPSESYADAKIDAVETSSVAGALNNITLAVQLQSSVRGLDPDGRLTSPVVVTISGLLGASAAESGGIVNIECQHALPRVWMDADGNEVCKLGIDPEKDSSEWRTEKAYWNSGEGTLKFYVLGMLDAGQDEKLRRFHLTVKLVNSERVQDLRRPTVSVCEHRPADALPNYESLGLYEYEAARGKTPVAATGYILGSNARAVDASDEMQTIEFTKRVGVTDMTVLKVTVPGGSMPAHSELIVSGLESEINKGLTDRMARRMPYRDVADVEGAIEILLAGARSTMLELRLQNKATNQPVSFLNDQVEVEMMIDEAVLRKRGTCYTPESNTVTVCLPGYVGIYKYVDSDSRHEWEFVPDIRESSASKGPTHQSRVYKTLISKIKGQLSSSSIYAVLATSPCNDYQGAGRAGGDRICVRGDEKDAASSEAYALLGAGTISKFPSIASTSRPPVETEAALDQYLKAISSDDADFKPRQPWKLVDLSKFPTASASFEPRFGHAMACVSGTRVLIYGGVGCATRNSSTGFCTATVLLNDLYEFDLLKWTGSGVPLRLLELSPILSGLAGSSLIVAPGEHHRILTFGGASVMYPITDILKIPQNQSEDTFEFRELFFRASKATNASISSVEAISSTAATSNSTHAILFGGYVGNSRTAAIYTYELAASSPDLALRPMLILATGPSARSMPGVVKPDDTSLLLYGGMIQADSGGVTRHLAAGDLWRFDLSTQAWLKVHDTLSTRKPRAYGAFGSVSTSTDTVLFTYGGLLEGFDSSTTFREVADSEESDRYQVSDQGQVYFASQIGSGDKGTREWWTSFRAKYSHGSWACCNFKVACPEADRGIGCVPPPRAFQTVSPGVFEVGRLSMILFGGLDRTGKSLGDLWYFDVEDQTEGKIFFMILSNITSVTPSHLEVFSSKISTGWGMKDSIQRGWTPSLCSSRSVIHVLSTADIPALPDSTVITFSTSQDVFDNCVRPVMLTAGALESAVWGTAMQGVQLDVNLQKVEGAVAEIRMPWYQYRSTEYCKAGKCARYCYDDLDDDGDNDYLYSWPAIVKGGDIVRDVGPCSAGYFCAAPGRRHGHSSETVLIEGDATMLLVVGGESGHWADDSQSLTMDLHLAYFTASFATWYKILTSQSNGDPCAGVLCPQPRRDASIKMMGNDGGNNGRLLLFGGLAAGEQTTSSVGRAYLERAPSKDVVALSDLWYLDMTSLTVDCVRGVSKCPILRWILVDVPGTQPAGRWGAGIVLDPSDNLYIIGGNHFDRAAKEFKVLSDIFIFQLRDPYYKYCSATGAGLFKTVAGVSSQFYLQCRDAFGEPANGASFKVQIKGKDEQPGLKPSPVPLELDGQYKCEYTAFKTGHYEIQISVGRGGGEHIDLIEGEDPEPSNDVHEYVFRPSDKGTTPQLFQLIVEPGETNAKASTAVGDAITTSTAGSIGTFLITAKDSFQNRRPGGEAVTSLMRYWSNTSTYFGEQDPSALPQTGRVIDNNDGSYAVTYRITKAGLYQHAISLVAAVGAGSPVFLHVSSDVADATRTYVYGTLLSLETGKPSTIYIQTRDKYGNAPRYTNEEKPCVGYPLSEDTCDQRIEYVLCKSQTFVEPCADQDVLLDVGKSLIYQMGPTASTVDSTGEPYFGLYQITVYFPAEAGGQSYLPLLYHNDTYVMCYFDSGDLVGTAAADPGWRLANACADINKAQTSSSRRHASSASVPLVYRRDSYDRMWARADEPMGVVRVQERAGLVARYDEESGEFGVDPSPRRGVSEISWENTKLSVQQQFKQPDTGELEKWLVLAPILCAIIGTLISVMHAAWDKYEARQNAKVHAFIAAMDGDVTSADSATGKALQASLTQQESTLDWAIDSLDESLQQTGLQGGKHSIWQSDSTSAWDDVSTVPDARVEGERADPGSLLRESLPQQPAGRTPSPSAPTPASGVEGSQNRHQLETSPPQQDDVVVEEVDHSGADVWLQACRATGTLPKPVKPLPPDMPAD